MNIDTSIFKAYDIRGVYPTQIDENIAYAIGQGFAKVTHPVGEVMVGCDVRIHSPALKQEIIKALNNAGVNTVDVGFITTDMLYFGVGKYGYDGGIQVTASHNPKEWHGAKMVRKGPTPISGETGIYEIRDFVMSGEKIKSGLGKNRQVDISDEYAKYILGWVDKTIIKPMKIVINPNFGMAGVVFRKIVDLGKLPITIIGLNDTPDGNFPKGRPDPLIPENRPEFVNLVKSSGADLGITWDADSDRVFFCADGGEFLEPYYLGTLLIRDLLKKYPHEKIAHDLRFNWALDDEIILNGGTPIITKVGHSFIKKIMKEENVIFAIETSGHTYYRDYWFSDCGMIPPIQLINILSSGTKKLSEYMSEVMSKYPISGEINSTVADPKLIMEKIAQKYNNGKIERLDGISVEYPNFRFNVRTSNTEPLMRLCLEARTMALMEEKRDEVLAVIRG